MMADVTTTIRDLLARGETYVGVPFGVSMEPMLHNRRDIIVVAPKRERLTRGDVGVFTRGDQCVLHRVVEVREDGYVFWGDNCVRADGFIEEARVIGKLEAVTRDGKPVDLKGRRYQTYVRTWDATRPVRCAFMRATGAGKRVARRIIRKK